MNYFFHHRSVLSCSILVRSERDKTILSEVNIEKLNIVVARLLKLLKEKRKDLKSKIFRDEHEVEREIHLSSPTKMKGWPNTFEERSVIFQISVNCSWFELEAFDQRRRVYSPTCANE